MHSRWHAIAILILISSLGRVHADESLQKGETVSDLLAACDSTEGTTHTVKCDRVFFGMLEASYMAAADPYGSGYALCLPPGDPASASLKYESDLLNWFRAHPDVYSKDVADAGYEATVAIYLCKRQ